MHIFSILAKRAIRETLSYPVRAVEKRKGSPLCEQREIDAIKLNPKRILVTTWGGLGDALLTMPAIKVLRKAFPSAQIVFLCARQNRKLVEYYRETLSLSILEIDEANGLTATARSFYKTTRALLKEENDLAISFGGNVMRDWLLMLCGAKNRIALNNQENPLAHVAHHYVNAHLGEHATREALRMLQEISLTVPDEVKPFFPTPLADIEKVAELLRANGFCDQNKILGVYSTSGGFMPQRNWTPTAASRFIEMACERGYKIMEVNGEQTIENVFEDILGKIDDKN